MEASFIKQFREKVRHMERELGWFQKNDIQCCGVTLAQCHALQEIGQRDEISIVEISGLLGVDTSTLSRTIDHLVKSGLVNRVLNPQDRRYVSLTLTEQGKAAFHTVENSFNTYIAGVFEFIAPEKHAQVMESLIILASALEQCTKKRQCCGSRTNDREESEKNE